MPGAWGRHWRRLRYVQTNAVPDRMVRNTRQPGVTATRAMRGMASLRRESCGRGNGLIPKPRAAFSRRETLVTFKTAAALSVAILLAGCTQAVVGPLFQGHSKVPEDIAPISITPANSPSVSDIAPAKTPTRWPITACIPSPNLSCCTYPVCTTISAKVEAVIIPFWAPATLSFFASGTA